MKMKYLLILLTTAIFVTSCNSTIDMAIDNPSNDYLYVKIDSLEVEVPPKNVVWVEFGKGKHTVSTRDTIVEFNFTESSYMLNPIMTEYLQYKEYYGNQYFSPSESKNAVNYLGIELTGDYQVVNKLINPVTWDCGPRETLPEMIEVESGDSYAYLTKLMDPNEFIQVIQSEMQQYESQDPEQNKE